MSGAMNLCFDCSLNIGIYKTGHILDQTNFERVRVRFSTHGNGGIMESLVILLSTLLAGSG